MKDVNSASAADLFGIDGFVLATTQTFQSVAGATKKFLEKLWINKDRIAKGELFASMICYKNDPVPPRPASRILPVTLALLMLLAVLI
ncbi:hypothetical protein C1G87_1442 [Dehalococcoides mccartyi]|uniref:Uncharacterized protein n=1 Tax=Dehalococcoides mccartyi TaxID=61435 RepID=A0A328EK37_9CHLR|nr:hypothetical protein C1G87_1442 [Dehalococcoides mccartyi]